MDKIMTTQEFLVNRDHTGRYIYESYRTGKRYFVEPTNTGAHRTDWGSYNPSTGKVEVKKGWDKYEGSVHPDDSIVTLENGFSKVHELGPGCSPDGYIAMLDAEYPTRVR